MLDAKPYNIDRIFRLVVTLGILWGLVALLEHLSDVLVPFAVAWLMAYLLNPLVNAVQRQVPHRFTAICLSLALVVALLSGTLWVLTPHVLNELRHLGSVAASVARDGPLAHKIRDQLGPQLVDIVQEAVADPRLKTWLESDDMMATAKSGLVSLAGTVMPGAVGLMRGTANLALGLFGLSVIGLYLVFLLMDFDAVRHGWQQLVPPAWREPVGAFVGEFNFLMGRYFRAQALMSLAMGVLYAIGFSLIGLPLAILFGLFAGLLNMVPYLQVLALPPALAFASVNAVGQGNDVLMACLAVLAVFAAIQIIQDAVLVPRMMGEATGLSPAMIMLSLGIWGKLLGFLGLILALPATCLLVSTYRRLIARQDSPTTAK